MNDVLANLRDYKGLRINLITTTEGKESYKICALEGYLSTIYQNNSYNIPISCWLPHRYPITNPVVYVKNPTNTSIQPSVYLEPDGLVKHPTLLYWDPKKSSLGKALRDISSGFSEHFPIVSGILTRPVVMVKENPKPMESRNFRLDQSNPEHQIYFEFEALERGFEERASQLSREINKINPGNCIKDLKQTFYELFLTNRKKEKCVLMLSKLG